MGNNSKLYFCNYFALVERAHNNPVSLESPGKRNMLVTGLNDANIGFIV